MITKQQLSEFKTTGYLRIRKVLSCESINEMFQTVVEAYKSYSGSLIDSDTAFTSWEDEKFSSALIKLRRQDQHRFSAIYDSMLASYALQKLCFNNRLGEYSAALLNARATDLCYRGAMLRMDVPGDTRNVYGWHQDSSYTNYNSNGLHAITAWCPLVNVTRHNGTLQVCEGSHVEPTALPTGTTLGKGYSLQNLVKSEVIGKYRVVDVEGDAGDVIFSYSSLIHRSGENSSDKVRFTAIVRYHQMLSQDFHLFPKD